MTSIRSQYWDLIKKLQCLNSSLFHLYGQNIFDCNICKCRIINFTRQNIWKTLTAHFSVLALPYNIIFCLGIHIKSTYTYFPIVPRKLHLMEVYYDQWQYVTIKTFWFKFIRIQYLNWDKTIGKQRHFTEISRWSATLICRLMPNNRCSKFHRRKIIVGVVKNITLTVQFNIQNWKLKQKIIEIYGNSLSGTKNGRWTYKLITYVKSWF